MDTRIAGRAVFAAAALAIAACQPATSPTPAATPTATEGAPVAPTPAPTTSSSEDPAATPVVSSTRVTLSLAGDGPVLGPDDGPPGTQYVMPAAGTRASNGELVLAIVWFGEDNAPPQITIARSSDGTSWDVGPQIMADLQIGYDDPGPIPTGILQLGDGSWQMYGWASADASGRTFWSWRTSAPDLQGPWALDATEMLPAGSSGSWDSSIATIATVQLSSDGYLAWYEGEPPGSTNRGDVGVASSADGLAWTKFDDAATTDAPFAESDPVISTAICGDASAVAVEQPQVERVGDQYLALFGGFSASGQTLDVLAATSQDGRSWECASAQPLLVDAAVANSEGFHTLASLPLDDARVGLLIESLEPASSTIWLASVEVAE